jgi:aminomuconate-semialdehyde/2-hydroxymuconate-6-semialdehyde dehydrogenase
MISTQGQILNFIHGEFVPALSKKTLDNYEPATGLVYTTLPASDAKDVDKAVQSCAQAFPAWSALAASERASVLHKISTLIEQYLPELSRAEAVDNGKPQSLAKMVDIPRSATNFRFFAEAVSQWTGESFQTSPTTLNYVLHQPLGVVGCISPWNLPLYLFTWKIAPALAAGNCVVAKPSEVTPMTAYLLAQICREAGLPAGVLNIVHGLGSEVGAALSVHPQIKAISFTGSTLTGQKIAEAAAPSFKKLALEMGGKNPAIIFADCDFEKTTSEIVRAAFSNQGQICLCGSRILVEDAIYEKFKQTLLRKIAALKVGDPLVEGISQGAVVSKTHFEKILHHIDLAKKEGGQVLCGGEAVQLSGRCEQGWFVAPTLIEGLTNSCRTNQEEIFGPVATLQKFSSESEALALANDSQYGLAASLWTQNLSRAQRMAAKIETGIVWINTWMNRDLRTPFGGVKKSGLGREGGKEALHFFTEPKTVCIVTENGEGSL